VSEDLLARAIDLASRASAAAGQGPFGAVVARGDEVLGEGTNRVVEGGDPTAHAEVEAIRAACARLGTHRLEGCVIYCSCEPCPMCYAAIRWARIPRVVFAASRRDAAAIGFDDEALLAELARDWAGRPVEHEQRDREAALEALRRWEADPDRIRY